MIEEFIVFCIDMNLESEGIRGQCVFDTVKNEIKVGDEFVIYFKCAKDFEKMRGRGFMFGYFWDEFNIEESLRDKIKSRIYNQIYYKYSKFYIKA